VPRIIDRRALSVTHIQDWSLYIYTPMHLLTTGKRSETRTKPLPLANGHGRYMLHNRYTRTGTCVRWVMAVTYNTLIIIFLPFRFLDGNVTATSLLKPPCGVFQKRNRHLGSEVAKNPLELLESPVAL
jgi:hypothetical protein